MEWNTSDSDMIRPILEDGEELVWAGRPVDAIRLGFGDVFAVLLGLGIGVLPLAYFVASAYESGNSLSMIGLLRSLSVLDWIIVALVTLAGFCFAFRGKVSDLLWMRHTYYGVTNLRVMTLSTFPRRKVESRRITPKVGIKRHVNRKGFGSLAFGVKFDPDDTEGMPKLLAKTLSKDDIADAIEFLNIQDAETVSSLVQHQIDASLSAQSSNGTEDVFPFTPDAQIPIAAPPRRVPLLSKLTVIFSDGIWVSLVFMGFGAIFCWAAASLSAPLHVFLLVIGLMIVPAGLIVISSKESMRLIRLLARGEASYGSIKSSKERYSGSGAGAIYDMVFVFRANNGKEYRAGLNVSDTGKLTDQAHEVVIYDPAKPSDNVLLDSITGWPQIDEGGVVRMERSWIGVTGALCALGLIVAYISLIVSYFHG